MIRVALGNIGPFLKDMRLGNQWTQENLAVMAGVSVPTIHRLERGDLTVKLTTLAKVSVALGVSKGMRIELTP